MLRLILRMIGLGGFLCFLPMLGLASFGDTTLVINKKQQGRAKVNSQWEEDKTPQIYYNKGVELLKLEKYQAAIQQFTASLELQPDFYKALYNRATALHKVKQYEKALEDFILLETVPEYNTGNLHIFIGASYSKLNKYDEAIFYYEKAIENDNYNLYTQARHTLGTIYFKVGRYEDAILYFDEFLEFVPTSSRGYNDRGSSYLMLDEYDKAITDYLTALHHDEENYAAYDNLGAVYRKIEEYDSAIYYYKKSHERNRLDYASINNLGICYFESGRYTEAIEQFQKALTIKREYRYAISNLGAALIKTGKLEEAKKTYDLLIHLYPDYGTAYLNRGIIAEEMRLLELMCSDWEKALELGIIQAKDFLVECN